MTSQADLALFNYVNRIINSGSTEIKIPGQLVVSVSKEAIEEVRRLCKLNGVRIVGV